MIRIIKHPKEQQVEALFAAIYILYISDYNKADTRSVLSTFKESVAQ